MTSYVFSPNLWRFTKSLNDCMEKLLKPAARRHGLTVTQAQVLCALKRLGPSTVGSVAKFLGMACTNTSAMCKKLAKMGFLHRKRRSDDERVVALSLTDVGENAVVDIETHVETVVGTAPEGADIRAQMIAALTEISELLQQQ